MHVSAPATSRKSCNMLGQAATNLLSFLMSYQRYRNAIAVFAVAEIFLAQQVRYDKNKIPEMTDTMSKNSDGFFFF